MDVSAAQLKTEEKAPAIVREADTTPGTQASQPWVIRMQGIGKRYRLGEVNRLNDNFREELTGFFGRLVGRSSEKGDPKGTFWALRDIDLEVARGDTVGIIGRNGAGKSTMIKILSRITTPTTGEMRYRGRLASLLEVGAGFHRELTGRENIYLNGSILGMRRSEIQEQFDAIVDFAGVEKFLETPVKFYSSGMYVRLAFAVAAHLRTDILVIDEVLAVGDAQFQKKCLGKMQDVAGDGKTVLFVSHNMTAVERLCKRAFWLVQGTEHATGPSNQIIAEYLQEALTGISNNRSWKEGDEPGNENVKISSLGIFRKDGGAEDPVYTTDSMEFRVRYINRIAGQHLIITLHVINEQDVIVFSTSTGHTPALVEAVDAVGRYESRVDIPGEFLNEGNYRLKLLVVRDGKIKFQIEEALAFTILPSAGTNHGYHGKRPGAVIPTMPWDTKRLED